ncbi:reverse transcriptase domain-containing protein [Tanacetum coccineum]
MADAHLVQNVPSRQTLEGAARNWFDDLDPKSVDSFEELSHNFLEEFSQQKIYAKDPTEIHGIKRRQNEGLQAFIDRFKSESSHIKGVPPVLHISAFMHGYSHPELAKKLNEKIPKTVDECSKGSEPSLGEKWPLDQHKWSVLLKETKDTFIRHGPEDLKEPEIRAAQGKHEGIWGCTLLVPEKILSPRLPRLRKKSSSWKAPQHQRLLSVEEANIESCGLGKIGSSSEGHMPKQLAEGNQGRNGVKVINMIRVEGSRKRPFKEGRSGIMNELAFLAIPQSQLTDEPIILEGIIEGNQVQRILVDGGSSSEIMYEHCFRNLIVNIRSRLQRIREQVILRSKSNPGRGPTSDPMSLGKTRSKEGTEEVFTISQECLDQYITMGGTLITNWEGLIRKVLHPEWITIAIPIKLTNGTWKVQMDYSGLNKACDKDMYPLPEEGKELASLMGYPYKCFFQLPKEYSQIRMAKEDEEKTGFHTEEEVLTDQRGRNVEIYLEEIVIKRKSEPDLVQDVNETLRKLKRVNIKIDSAMSSFEVKEGRFLGYIVTKEGLRADLRRIQAITLSPTPRSPNQIRSLFLQLTSISKFIPKLAELKHPLREARTRMQTSKGPG